MCEGHDDTRERWTCNFTTFSDRERIKRGELPYCEFMFRADGEKIQCRLREYIRSRGFGPWVSATTSQKASYRLADILEFLERHLPPYSESRPWGIMRADDFSAHLNDAVFRLCWERKYVFIPHGGGVTPVTQTVDTDCNGIVRPRYVQRESQVLIVQMRDGKTVPSLSEEECIELMAAV